MINIEKFADKLDHHDLIIIEEALQHLYSVRLSQYFDLRSEVDNLPSLSDCSLSDRKFIIRKMKRLCHRYDDMLECKRLLDVYSQVRLQDYEEQDY